MTLICKTSRTVLMRYLTAGRGDAQALGFDHKKYTREELLAIVQERPWLNPKGRPIMYYVWTTLKESLVRWQELVEDKGKVFDAYRSLHEDLRKALDIENRKAMKSGKVLAFRSGGKGPWPSSMGGQSLHVELDPWLASRGIRHVRVYEVSASDVMIHPDIPGSPLGEGQWKFEREMILKPSANPKRLSDDQASKVLAKLA